MIENRCRLTSSSDCCPTVYELLNAGLNDLSSFTSKAKNSTLECVLSECLVLQRKTGDVITKELDNLGFDCGSSFVLENSSEDLVFICVYLLPISSKFRVLPEQLELFIENSLANAHLCSQNTFNVTYFLLGDFNLPAYNWSLITSASCLEQETVDIFLNFHLSH